MDIVTKSMVVISALIMVVLFFIVPPMSPLMTLVMVYLLFKD